MKKTLIILGIVFLITGCKNQLKCTKEMNEELYNSSQTIVFDIEKDDIVTNYSSTYKMIFQTEDDAKSYFKILENVFEDDEAYIDKNSIVLKNSGKYLEQNQKREKIKDQYENDGFTCK